MKNEINNSVENLRKEGIILCPTDTIWGLSCDATSDAAVEKIFRIKKRPGEKSLIVLVSGEAMLKKYVSEIPPAAYELIAKTQTPLTIIYDKGVNLAKNVMGDDGSVAIRIPKDEFCSELINLFGKPIVSTSANLSGQPAPKSYSEINPRIINSVDYVVNLKQKGNGRPSSLIKVSAKGEVRIIRK